jgi:hypothetical protein
VVAERCVNKRPVGAENAVRPTAAAAAAATSATEPLTAAQTTTTTTTTNISGAPQLLPVSAPMSRPPIQPSSRRRHFGGKPCANRDGAAGSVPCRRIGLARSRSVAAVLGVLLAGCGKRGYHNSTTATTTTFAPPHCDSTHSSRRHNHA